MSKEMNIEEAIERLKYIDMAYDCNNYYSRYDLDCISTVLSELESLKQEYNNELDEGLKMSELLKEQAKEIKKLREENTSWKIAFNEEEKEIERLSNIKCELELTRKSDYISKDKIKKSLKKLDAMKESIYKGYYARYTLGEIFAIESYLIKLLKEGE